LLRLDALGGCNHFAVEPLDLRERADDEGTVVFEFDTGVARHVELLEFVVDLERLDREQPVNINEIDCHIELAQLFVALQIFNLNIQGDGCSVVVEERGCVCPGKRV